MFTMGRGVGFPQEVYAQLHGNDVAYVLCWFGIAVVVLCFGMMYEKIYPRKWHKNP